MADKQSYQLIRDAKYGFLQVSPLPSDEEVREFYAREFYSGDYKNFNNSSLEVQERDADYHRVQREMLLATVERLLGGPVAGRRVFDFGCGWGLTLQFLRGKGAECRGVDPSPEAVAYGQRKGLQVQVGNIDNLDLSSEGDYDVVLLQNVLEHLRDPEHALRRLGQTMRPGGVIVCAVPNDFNALQQTATAELGLPDWWVAPPAHLSYFDRDSLTTLLGGCGFTARHTECSFPIEMFLLFGDNYIGNGSLGRQCHEKRMNFEMALVRQGRQQLLADLYRTLGELGVGRILTVFATKD
ncbi:MAG: class I SAM-dependent methyltransferase [Burkholderiales bacterium]|nr:class I SAM-dependent methyltransferase [Burkholderiales bacterium]